MNISIRTLTLIAALSASTAFSQTRSQQSVLIDVRNVFLQQPVFKGMAIEPSLHNGVVTLTGTVTSEAAKELASDKVGDIAGVKTVLNNLVVAEPGSHAGAPPAPAPATMGAPETAGDQVKILTLKPPATIPVRIREELNTHTAKPGDTFHGVTATAVYQSGVVLIPAKTPVTGRVVSSKAARPFVGYAQLSLELTAIRLPVPQVGDKTLQLATLPLNSQGSAGSANSSGGFFGSSAGVNGRNASGPPAGTQIIVQPEAVLEFSTAGPLLVAVQVQNGLPVPQDPATGDAVLPVHDDAATNQAH